MRSFNSGSEVASASPRFCSNCGQPERVGDARFCKNCGAALASGFHFKHDLDWNPWIAAGLSVLPGLGHLYKGQHLYAVLWFFGVVLAYYAGPIGPVLHLVCIANATLGGAIDFPKSRISAAGTGPNGLANRR
jgi:hypothetical protein